MKKFIKIIAANLAFLLMTCNVTLHAQFKMPDLKEEDMQALQQDILEIDKYINSLPEDVRKEIEEEALKLLAEIPDDELEKLLEFSAQIAEGMPTTNEAREEFQLPEPEPAAKEPEKDPSAKKQTNQQTKAFRALVQSVIDQLDSLKVKTAALPRISDRPQLEQKWSKEKQSIDELRAYLSHIINPVAVDKDVIVAKLITDEHSDYRTKLKQLKSALNRTLPSIKLPDQAGIKKANSKALRALNQLITDISNLSIPTITKQTKELLKKYAPKEVKKAETDFQSSQKNDYDSGTSSSDDNYYPSRGHRAYHGYDEDSYYPGASGANYYPDMPGQRFSDDGRYVQQPRRSARRKRAGGGRTAAPRGKRSAPAKGRSGKTPRMYQKAVRPPKIGPSPMQKDQGQPQAPELKMKGKSEKFKQKFGTQIQEFLESFNELGQKVDDKDLPFNQVTKYLTTSTPDKKPEKFNVSLDEITSTCNRVHKKIEALNKSIKKLSQPDQVQIRDELSQFIKAPEVDVFFSSLESLKLAPEKKSHEESLKKAQAACKQLTDAIKGEEKKSEEQEKTK